MASELQITKAETSSVSSGQIQKTRESFVNASDAASLFNHSSTNISFPIVANTKEAPVNRNILHEIQSTNNFLETMEKNCRDRFEDAAKTAIAEELNIAPKDVAVMAAKDSNLKFLSSMTVHTDVLNIYVDNQVPKRGPKYFFTIPRAQAGNIENGQRFSGAVKSDGTVVPTETASQHHTNKRK